MFPLFLSSHNPNENLQWYHESMINYFYPTTFIPTPLFQVEPTQVFGNLDLKEQKPNPSTQQNQIDEKQVSQVKIENFDEENLENQIFLKNKTQKRKRAKHYKKKIDKVYYPNSSTNVSSLAQQRFLKKNIEYNLLNQIFSYIWSEKKSYSKILQYYDYCEEKARLFYQFFKILKRGIKRIISLSMLRKLCNFRHTHPGFKTISRKKQLLNILNFQQFSSGVRFLVNTYLKQYCQLSILTSKKMRKHLLIQHLEKARELRNDIFRGEEEDGSSQISQTIEEEDPDNHNFSDSC